MPHSLQVLTCKLSCSEDIADFGLMTLTFWQNCNWCRMSSMSTFLTILVLLQLFFVEMTWRYNLHLWGHRACRWCGSSNSICIPRSKFVGLPTPKIWLISITALSGLIKWGNGSPVSWASFLTNLSLLCPSVFDSGSGTRQMDRQTDDGHQCIMPHAREPGA